MKKIFVLLFILAIGFRLNLNGSGLTSTQPTGTTISPTGTTTSISDEDKQTMITNISNILQQAIKNGIALSDIPKGSNINLMLGQLASVFAKSMVNILLQVVAQLSDLSSGTQDSGSKVDL